MTLKRTLLILAGLWFTGICIAQSCKDVSVELSASVQPAPAAITLHWVSCANATQHSVFRKLKASNAWGGSIANLSGSDTQYTDTTVTAGVSYDYRITRSGNGFTGYGYINAGIEIPAVEFRGNIIVLIDSTFADSLSNEFARLEADLSGDGWKTIRHTISPTASVTAVKAIIVNDYNQAPAATRAVFLLGHIPVPYSGNINPDGHTDHKGAWPADAYYADINGSWTDASVNSTTATDTRNINIPGDGKFDQSTLPSDLELQLGRVDFHNMPAFTASAMQLLKNYLDKDHDYRHKIFRASQRAVVDDNFGYFSGEAFAASGWKNFGPLVGPSRVEANDYFLSQADSTYLWAYGCGGGTYTSAGGIGSTADFATANLKGVFSMLFGSYFGDWDSQNNFLRAPLAQGKCLTNVWSGRPHWQFHHMALGENIGYDVRISQNNTNVYFSNYAGRFVNNALMGDPSLRNDVLAPVTDVIATRSGTNCHISWTASSDSVSGYHIYSKNDSMLDYSRLNPFPISGNSFTDTCLLFPGTYTYMVRAIMLQTSAAGTYYNLSQGITDTAWNPNNLAVNADASFSAQGNVIVFQNNSTNATDFVWDFGDGGMSTLANPTHAFPDGNYVVRLLAYNGCDADTLALPISILTGIRECTNLPAFYIYPNPSSGKIILIGNSADNVFDKISVYTPEGKQLIIIQSPVMPYNLDLSAYAKGLYLIRLSRENNTSTQSLIVR